jgi:RimJ/RimL family protein N-acetyltransferase
MIDLLALADGTILTIQPIERGDGARLGELFAHLTPESRYRRFLTSKPRLTRRELAVLTNVDHLRHEALVAVDETDGSFVAAARYVELNDRPWVAELAVEVADGFQSAGIGTALAGHVLARARAAGMQRLVATTLRENAPARALAHRLGFRASSSSGPEIELELALEDQRCSRQAA